MTAQGPNESADKSQACPKCGKRFAAEAKAGSLTGYFFQSFYCRCGRTERQSPAPGIDDGVTFCPKCGLRTGHGGKRGSISEFLFQDIRCKCATASPAFNEMSVRFKRLKEEAETDDQSISIFQRGRGQAGQKGPMIGLKEGALIGGSYRIIKLIGRGGFGEVYQARHQALNKLCALKVIPPYQVSEDGWLRFKQEARVISKLNHKNVVQVSDLGVHENCLPYYAMEFVEGPTLAQMLAQDKKLPLSQTLNIFLQVCDALEYAHKQGVIHRDLKPANIMITTGKEKSVVKILDFGLAKLSQRDQHQQSLTMAGDIFGSPLYMSPEQCSGEIVDHRTDIYSTGCTMFECLTGNPPFTGSQSAAIIFAQQEAEPPTLASTVGTGHFPEAMEIVLAKLLRKNPVERYQSMTELRSDLVKVQNGEEVQPYYLKRSSAATAFSAQPQSAENTGGGGRKKLIVAAAILLLLPAAAATVYFGRSNYAQNSGSKAKTLPATESSAAAVKATAARDTPTEADPLGDLVTSQMIPAWEMISDSEMGERLRVLVTEEHIQFTNDNVTYAIGAPNYDQLTIFNPDHKTYVIMTMKEWERGVTKQIPIVVDKVTPLGSGNVLGMDCQHFHTSGHFNNRPEITMNGDLWTTKDGPAKPELMRASCIFSGVPPGYGMPIKYIFHLSKNIDSVTIEPTPAMGFMRTLPHNGEAIVVANVHSMHLITTDAQKLAMPPKGYKRVNEHMDLYTQDFVDGISVGQ